MQNIMYCIKTPKDVEAGKLSKVPMKEIPSLEACPCMQGACSRAHILTVDNIPSPRMMKSHLPYSFLQRAISASKAKVIVVLRNPKDTIVSFYHFYKANVSLGLFPGTFQEFYDMFMNNQLIYGDWFEFNLQYWNKRQDPNFLVVSYEEMIENLPKVVKQVATFMGEDLSDANIMKIAKMTSFGAMKETVDPFVKKNGGMKSEISTFMRKGIVGDWKNHFTVAQSEDFDKVYSQKMAGSGLKFTF